MFQHLGIWPRENWKSHPQLSAYEISDMGRVRRLLPARGARVGRILMPGMTRQGYRHVVLEGKARRIYVLVLETFVGPRPIGAEVRHLNDVKSDDRLSNLAWGTKARNYADRVANGGGNHGVRHGLAKLNDAAVQEIRRRYVPHQITQRMLAKEYGVSRECIKLICGRQRWRHV